MAFQDYPFFRGGAFLPIAHRGGSRRFPENTEAAFEGARNLGFRHIETDVHLSADGHLVLFHDSCIERTTEGRGAVASMTLAELRTFDVGHNFSPGDGSFPYRGQGLTVMTLEEALSAFPDLYFNVEMKGSELPIADALHEFVSAHGVHDQVLAAAADDRLTQRFRSSQGNAFQLHRAPPGLRGFGPRRASAFTASCVFPFRRFRFRFITAFSRS